MFRFAPVLLVAILFSDAIPDRVAADEPPKEFLGKWVSQEDEAHPMIFGKDGSFQYGSKSTNGKWMMAPGKFTYTADGKITATVMLGSGANLRPHFKFGAGVIVGSKGPSPRVEWKKVGE